MRDLVVAVFVAVFAIAVLFILYSFLGLRDYMLCLASLILLILFAIEYRLNAIIKLLKEQNQIFNRDT